MRMMLLPFTSALLSTDRDGDLPHVLAIKDRLEAEYGEDRTHSRFDWDLDGSSTATVSPRARTNSDSPIVSSAVRKGRGLQAMNLLIASLRRENDVRRRIRTK